MDFVPLIDQYGENATHALIGLVLAFAFGVLAQRSAFCTRSAVLSVIGGGNKSALPVWLLAFGAAVIAVQALLGLGIVDVSESRFFSSPLSLSGALIGGTVFGFGMALARGCTSRLLVLGAGGNLRALTAVFVTGLAAWATLYGPLVSARDAIGALLTTAPLGTNDLASVSPLGSNTGFVMGVLAIIIACWLAIKGNTSPFLLVGGVLIGGLVALGWWATHEFSGQVFEPVQIESLSFVRPTASVLVYGSSSLSTEYLNIDVGSIIGVLAGAFLASLAFRQFRVAGFGETGSVHFSRYVIGGALMGFGGILALGCTIGAGFTGGSVLAINSLVGLAAMIIGCGIFEKLLQRTSTVQQQSHLTTPAE